MTQNMASEIRRWCVVAGVCAAASTVLARAGADVPATDAPVEEDARSTKDVRRTARPDEWGGVPMVDVGRQRVPTAARAQEGPTRIGVTIDGGPGFALVDLALDGLCDVTARLEPLGRVRVRSEGAEALRLKFAEGSIPAGAVLRVYDGAGRMVAAKRGGAHSAWWTPSIAGETALVEYVGAAEEAELPTVRVETIGVIDPTTMTPAGAAARFVNSCSGGSVDLACHAEVPTESELQRSVVRMNFAEDGGGISTCTGTLVRDAQGGVGRPWILTAAHCIDSPSEASSVEASWFYYARGGATPCLRSLPFNEGATLGATVASCDMSVLVLSSAPPAEAVAAPINVSAIGSNERGFTSFHHAGGGPQKYWTRPAIGRGSCVASDGSWRAPTSVEFPFAQGQSLGTFEGGASGGPLFDSAGRVRGTVRGICYPPDNNFDFCVRQGEVRHYFGSLAEAWRLGLSAGFAPPPADDAFEPNNTLAQARAIGATGAAYPLQLLDLDDYFTITTTVAGRLEIALVGTPTTAGVAFDPDLFLLDSAGSELARSDSPGSSESVGRDVNGGTFVVRVQRFTSGTNETGSYRLTPRFTPSVVVPPGVGGTPAPPPLPSGTTGEPAPIPTSPVVDRLSGALTLRLERVVGGAELRGGRVVDGLVVRVGALRTRGVSEERITAVIAATRMLVETLRLSATLAVVRTADGTSRGLERLTRRPGEIAEAAAAARETIVPQSQAAALERLTTAFDALVARVDEVQ